MRDYRHRGLMFAAVLGIGVLLVVAGCSNDSPAGTTTPTASPSTTMDMSGGMEGDHEFTFGHPADAAEATRIIEIEALDALKFDPPTVSVKVGETVTFQVHNGGKLPHEFGLGTAEDQAEHEQEMQDMAGSGMAMDADSNAFALEPGETKELTWTFTETGEVLYGCHEPGHYDAGMVGTITVE